MSQNWNYFFKFFLWVNIYMFDFLLFFFICNKLILWHWVTSSFFFYFHEFLIIYLITTYRFFLALFILYDLFFFCYFDFKIIDICVFNEKEKIDNNFFFCIFCLFAFKILDYFKRVSKVIGIGKISLKVLVFRKKER